MSTVRLMAGKVHATSDRSDMRAETCVFTDARVSEICFPIANARSAPSLGLRVSSLACRRSMSAFASASMAWRLATFTSVPGTRAISTEGVAPPVSSLTSASASVKRRTMLALGSDKLSTLNVSGVSVSTSA